VVTLPRLFEGVQLDASNLEIKGAHETRPGGVCKEGGAVERTARTGGRDCCCRKLLAYYCKE